MSYADSLLADGRAGRRSRERQHWLVLVLDRSVRVARAPRCAVVLLFGSAAVLAPDGISGGIRTLLGWVTLILVVGRCCIWIGLVVGPTGRARSTCVTNRRVIQVRGRHQQARRPTARSRRSTTPCSTQNWHRADARLRRPRHPDRRRHRRRPATGCSSTRPTSRRRCSRPKHELRAASSAAPDAAAPPLRAGAAATTRPRRRPPPAPRRPHRPRPHPAPAAPAPSAMRRTT